MQCIMGAMASQITSLTIVYPTPFDDVIMMDNHTVHGIATQYWYVDYKNINRNFCMDMLHD